MKAYEYWLEAIPKNYKSDGCTFAPDMNFGECCRMHDYLRQQNKVSAHRADTLMRDCIRDRQGWLIAYIYFLAVRFAKWTGLYG